MRAVGGRSEIKRGTADWELSAELQILLNSVRIGATFNATDKHVVVQLLFQV